MAYIGKTPVIGNFVKLDAISVVNGQAAYTMNNGGSAFTAYNNVNQFLVSLNGILQSPTDSFTVSGSTLTFASNLSTGDVIDFVLVLGNSLDIGTPSDNTVTAAKLNNDIISGSTELASEPADTDEFLVSDAGTLKRIDYSLIKGGGRYTLLGTTTISGGTTFVDLDDVFTDSYKTYLLVGAGIDVNTDGADMHIQGKSDSSTVISGGSDYAWNYRQQDAGGTTVYSTNSTASDVYRLNYNGVGNAASESANFEVRIFNARTSSHNTTFYGHSVSQATDGTVVLNKSVAEINATTNLTGIRFKSSSGNLDAGRIRIYGAND